MPAIRMIHANENGFVLTTTLIFITIIGLLGSTAIMVTTTDIKIGGNYKDSRQAFYDAEAGVQYAKKKIESDLTDGNLTLPSSDGSSISLSYTAPTGFSFTLSGLTKSSANRYTFTSTGTGVRNSQTSIEAALTRASAINYAAFGDVEATFKNGSNVYSYDSGTTPNPAPGDSTGDGDVGSNELLETKNGVYVDGGGVLGADASGTDATLTNTGNPGASFNGEADEQVSRVDPDPLGVIGGEYAANFTTYSTSNDNNLASPAIVSNEIDLPNSGAITLTGVAGGANYYLTSINLRNSSEIIIDASAGPVNVYLTGPLSGANGAEIRVINGGPTDFTLLSNSTGQIDIKNSGDFNGMIYAPYADLIFHNSSTIYGAVWGKTVDFKSTANLYYDTALKEKFQSNDLTLSSWKEVRG